MTHMVTLSVSDLFICFILVTCLAAITVLPLGAWTCFLFMVFQIIQGNKGLLKCHTFFCWLAYQHKALALGAVQCPTVQNQILITQVPTVAGSHRGRCRTGHNLGMKRCLKIQLLGFAPFFCCHCALSLFGVIHFGYQA